MKFEKQYILSNWDKWIITIRLAVEDFYNQYNIYPDCLFANEYTLSQIDTITKMKLESGFDRTDDIVGEYQGSIDLANAASKISLGLLCDKIKRYDIIFYYKDSLKNHEFILGLYKSIEK